MTGSQTITEAQDVLSVLFSGQSSSDFNGVLREPSSIAAGAVIETAVRVFAPRVDFTMIGIAFTDGTAATSKTCIGGFYMTADNRWLVQKFAGTLTAAPVVDGGDDRMNSHTTGLLYMRMTFVSANTWRAEYSPDGVSWTQGGLSDRTETFTPTHIGLVWSAWGGSHESIASFEYFRVTP